MYKSKFTLSDDTEEFEGYTDGSLDWDADKMNRETLEAVLEYIRNMGTNQPVVVSWNKYE